MNLKETCSVYFHYTDTNMPHVLEDGGQIFYDMMVKVIHATTPNHTEDVSTDHYLKKELHKVTNYVKASGREHGLLWPKF